MKVLGTQTGAREAKEYTEGRHTGLLVNPRDIRMGLQLT
jgi:hypothetical protein